MSALRKSSLVDTHPEIALQADGWDPTTVSPGSDLKKRWKCDLGHSWDASVSSRSLAGNGCPVCSNQKVLPGFNDLASRFPELGIQAHGWDPTTTAYGTGKKLAWKCPNEHIYLASARSRTKQGTGCPVCSGHVVLTGFNDLATTHPHLAAQIVNGDPTKVSRGSRTKFTWKCLVGHEFEVAIFNVVAGKWCPYCAGQKVKPGFNDFATKFPQLAKEAHGWDPTTTAYGTGKKLAWKCPNEHIYWAGANSRGRGSGCPFCSGQRLLAGFNDLLTTHPEISSEANGWDPREVLNGSTRRLSWKCRFGHVWTVSPGNRTYRSSGCPVCAGQIALKGFNDLQSKFPEIAAEADGWDPSEVTAFSHTRKKWKCAEGHNWIARISGRTNVGAGCPSCAKGGFDPNKDGYLYLIFHDQWEMHQIGITNFPDKRLNSHRLLGWTTEELRGPMDGHLTQQLETSCLHALERRGAILGHKAGIAKFDGYSEAWTQASLKVTSIKQILEWVYEDEGIHRG